MPASDINYLAVLVAAIVTFLIGGLWYSPLLFGKLWIKLHGYGPEKIQEMQRSAGRAYFGSFVAYVVMALVFAVLVGWTAVTTAAGGAWLGFLLWLGFAATIGLTASLFSDRSLGVWALDAAYQLVYLVVMGVILTLWR